MEERKKASLYPDYLAVVAAAALAAIQLVLILALLDPPRVGREIDFTAQYQPRPEWYFLWLYQLVRYFPGNWAFFGTVVLPVLLMAVLFGLPYIGRGINGRRRAALAGIILLAVFVTLTVIPLIDQ